MKKLIVLSCMLSLASPLALAYDNCYRGHCRHRPPHHHPPHHHHDDDVIAMLTSENDLDRAHDRYHRRAGGSRHRVLLAAEEDASAYLAGQEKSALLSIVIDEARKAAVEKAGVDAAKQISDEDIAFQIIDEVEKLKASAN